MTDRSLLSSHSTSPSSSDNEEDKLKYPNDLIDGKITRARSYSSSGSFLDNIPEANIEEEAEDTRGRRGSLPGDYSALRKSPRKKDMFHSLISGEIFLDDLRLTQKPKSRFSIGSNHESIIPEEDLQVIDKDVSLRVNLPIDKQEEPYSFKRRNPDFQESIKEEKNEEDRLIVRHDEFIKLLERSELEGSPHTSFISISSESIKEVEEESEGILFRHDEFLRKITKQDENYVTLESVMSSNLQEVDEEDEDI